MDNTFKEATPVVNVTYLFLLDYVEIMPRLQGNANFSFQKGQLVSSNIDTTIYWVKDINTLCVYHDGSSECTLMVQLHLTKNALTYDSK